MTVEKDFNKLLSSLSDKEFWDYVRYWKDRDAMEEEMRAWDVETKRLAIRDIQILKTVYNKDDVKKRLQSLIRPYK